MGFHSAKVPGFNAYIDGLQFEEELPIDHGNPKSKVIFCVSNRFLRKIFGDRIIEDEEIYTNVEREYLAKAKLIVATILQQLKKSYRGFTSPILLVETIYFCLDDFEYANAYVIYKPKDYTKIYMGVSFNCLAQTEAFVRVTLIHEFYHVISDIHEGEERIKNELLQLHRNDEAVIKQMESEFFAMDERVLTSIRKHASLKSGDESLILIFCRQHFFANHSLWFHSEICDLGLTIIAIELGDIGYLDEMNRRDAERVRQLNAGLNEIKNIRLKAMSESWDRKNKNLLNSALNLMEFMLCSIFYPFDGVAYHVLAHSHNWASHHPYSSLSKDSLATKNITQFEAIVTELCSREVSTSFLKFYGAFTHIIKSQAIHNDPLNPAITQQIHNTETLNRSKSARRIHRAEFDILFRQFKRWM